MPHPHDDSCPKCGEANGTGYACSPCYVLCSEHDEYHHPDEECQLCQVDEALEEMNEGQLDYIRDQLRILKPDPFMMAFLKLWYQDKKFANKDKCKEFDPLMRQAEMICKQGVKHQRKATNR